MNYQKAWLKLKESLEHDSKNGHNSMTSMSEGSWTEIISGNIVEQMNRLEAEMMSEAGFDIEDSSEKVEKPIFLVKLIESHGDTVAIKITANNSVGSVTRGVSKALGVAQMLVSMNIESVVTIGSELVGREEKKTTLLNKEQYIEVIEELVEDVSRETMQV